VKNQSGNSKDLKNSKKPRPTSTEFSSKNNQNSTLASLRAGQVAEYSNLKEQNFQENG
jgi:hypothetical protein